MARFILGLVELGVSAAVHLLFGLYVFSTAVAADISQAAAAGLPLLRRPAAPAGLLDVAADERRGDAAPVVLDGSPPPIVLVHGIFGFGKGVRNVTRALLTGWVFGEMPARRAPAHSVGALPDAFFVLFFCPRAEARGALLLRRRREEGRPRARAGFGLAHQHP
jgi:hypothetical protein